MKSKLLNDFSSYQNTLRKICGDIDVSKEDKKPFIEEEASLDELLSVVEDAEKKLDDVQQMTNSYNKIIKMIFK